jgi:hypothetical protein
MTLIVYFHKGDLTQCVMIVIALLAFTVDIFSEIFRTRILNCK